MQEDEEGGCGKKVDEKGITPFVSIIIGKRTTTPPAVVEVDTDLLWRLEALARAECARNNNSYSCTYSRKNQLHAAVDDGLVVADSENDGPSLNREPYCEVCDTGHYMRRDDATGFSGVCVQCGTVERPGTDLVVGSIGRSGGGGGAAAEGGGMPVATAYNNSSVGSGSSYGVHDHAGSGGRCMVDSLLPISSMGTRQARRPMRPSSKYVAVVHDRTRMPYAERVRYHLFREMDRIVRELMGDMCAELTAAICRAAHATYVRVSLYKPKTRGATRKGLLAWSVLEACAEMNAARRPKDVARAARLTTKQLGHAQKICRDTPALIRYSVSSRSSRDTCSNDSVIDASRLLARACAQLVDILDEQEIKTLTIKAKQILYALDIDTIPDLCGRAPSSVASGAVLSALRDLRWSSRVSRGRVSAATGVSVVTSSKMQKLIDREAFKQAT